MIALTVCSSMLIIFIFAKILGSMIPLFVKKIKLDPALIANPAISSISDAVLIVSVYPTEKALRKNFNDDGTPR